MLEKVQTGDRIAIAGNSFVSKAIIGCMKHWAKKKGIAETWIPSHYATLTVGDGVILVHGSIENGFKPEVLEDVINGNDNWIIYRTAKGYNDWQKSEVVRYVAHLTKLSVMYNYFGLLLWIMYIYLGIDWFPKHGGESVEYCYASTKRIMEHVDPSGTPYNANKVDAFDPHRKDDQIIIDNRVL